MERYPLIEEIHTPLTAPEIFELLHSELNSLSRDSGMDPQRLGKYSFMGTDPFLVMTSRGNQVTLIRQGKQENKEGNPFDFLGKLLETYRLDSPTSPIPFWGGAVGYLSYDLCHFIERLPTTAIDDLKLPESYFGFYDTILAFDNLESREYIAAGDVFQVNLSQRFETELTVTPYELYRRLRQINPAPFAGYLNFDGVTIISASPERFLHVDGDWVETRPIKGTRPRGKNPVEDAMLAQELLNSAKDRAENVMIVDLERNDLGRVCQYGTVKVTELAVLETFPNVFHLTSTVIGKLRPDKNRTDLLKATFPGGSITGAPKERAMVIFVWLVR